MSPLVRLDQLQQFAAVNLTLDQGYIKQKKRIPNCAEITLGWTLEGGKSGHNVLHASYSGTFPGSAANASAILTALVNHANWAPFAAFLAIPTTLVALTVRDLNVVDQLAFASTSAGRAGTSASAALPSEVAACVTLSTGGSGPMNRGRMYLPGFATNALGAGNVIAAAAVTAINNWVSIIAGTLTNNGGYTLGIGHLERQAYDSIHNGSHHDARPAGVVPVLSVACRDNHWDSIRRRGLK